MTREVPMTNLAFSSNQTAAEPVEALLHQIGQRVRAKRNELRMPRRVLSEISGVSPRYLAQLESGQGNISIALLQRIVAALDTSIIELVSDYNMIEAHRFTRLFLGADHETQLAVLARLEGVPSI